MEAGGEHDDAGGSSDGVGEEFGGVLALGASGEEAAEGFEGPGAVGGFGGEHVIEDDVGRGGGGGEGFDVVAGDESPAEIGIGAGGPVAVVQDAVGGAVTKVGEAFVVGEGEAKGVEVVLETDDVERAGVGDGFVAANGGHGVGGGAESDVPEDEGTVGGFAEAGGEVGLIDVERLGLVHRGGAGVHDLAAVAVEDAGEAFVGGVDLVVAEAGFFDGFGGLGVDGMIEVVDGQGFALGAIEIEEGAFEDGGAEFPHELVVEEDVVFADELPAEGFVGFREVVEVGAGVAGAGGTGADGVEGGVGKFVDAAAELDKAAGGESAAAAGNLRGDDAVEHVDAAVDGFEDVERGADAHEVAGFVAGEEFGSVGAGVFAFGFGFADGEAAEGEAVEGEVGEPVGALAAELWADGSLDDAEEGGGRVAAGGEAADGPALGEFDGGTGGGFVGGGGDALVERHHDVAADGELGFDADLGAEEESAAVDVAAEAGSGFGEGAGVGE